jgi:hypothetical protein
VTGIAPRNEAELAGLARSFGEEGGRLTYGSYLRLEQLLGEQKLQSEPPAHDELLFITVHQVYELWFKQLLHELVEVRAAMFRGELWWARHLLTRVDTIEHVLIGQVEVLETMTPQDFLEFRSQLAPASGFQSVQFRELEFLSGPRTPASSTGSAGSPTPTASGSRAGSTSPRSGTPSSTSCAAPGCRSARATTATRSCAPPCSRWRATARRTARSGSWPSACWTTTPTQRCGAAAT